MQLSLLMLNIFRLLPCVNDQEEQNLIWSYIHSNISKLLETEDDVEDKVRQTLEMFLILDDSHQNNLKLAVNVIRKFLPN